MESRSLRKCHSDSLPFDGDAGEIPIRWLGISQWQDRCISGVFPVSEFLSSLYSDSNLNPNSIGKELLRKCRRKPFPDSLGICCIVSSF